jgi:hypothetical protein
LTQDVEKLKNDRIGKKNTHMGVQMYISLKRKGTMENKEDIPSSNLKEVLGTWRTFLNHSSIDIPFSKYYRKDDLYYIRV